MQFAGVGVWPMSRVGTIVIRGFRKATLCVYDGCCGVRCAVGRKVTIIGGRCERAMITMFESYTVSDGSYMQGVNLINKWCVLGGVLVGVYTRLVVARRAGESGHHNLLGFRQG